MSKRKDTGQSYEQKVIPVGSSIGIIIPKYAAKVLGLVSGDYVELSLDGQSGLKLNKRKTIREGWDEMFALYAKERKSEENLEIPEFLDKNLF